jgi:predicted RNA-binding protein associated with RNAse of E/G family
MIQEDRVRGELTFDFVRPPNRRISIRSLLLAATDQMIVVALEYSPSKPLDYLGETVLNSGYLGISFLFKNRPFVIGRVYRPDRTWTGYYVDVSETVQWEGSDPNTLRPVTDLYLDLWIAPDGKYVTLDEDELEEAISLGHLASGQVDHARSVLRELVEATERGEFPPPVVRDFRL